MANTCYNCDQKLTKKFCTNPSCDEYTDLSKKQNNKADYLNKPFPITSVCRQDLEDAGYDVKNVSDDDMETLANDMANAYCEQGFWIDLPILADNLKIPKLTQ